MASTARAYDAQASMTTGVVEVPLTPAGDDVLRRLGLQDHLVFSVMLASSAIIGDFFACHGGRQRTAAEFLVGDRKMGVFSIAMSLTARLLHRQMATAYDFTISLLWIGLILLLASGLRRLVKSYYDASSPNEVPFIQVLIEEAIAAAELCGCCFELIIVADNYGVSAYAVLLFILTIWWSNCWGNSTACPYNHLEDVLTGDTDMKTALLKAVAQLVGGISVFRLTQYLWGLELARTHIGRAEEDCTADLQVTMFAGALIEGTATCLCRICSKALGDLQKSYSVALDAFIGTSLVVAAFNYSGGYFNPVLATSLKFGCKGNTAVEHLVVYWIGACCGALLSVVVYKHPSVQRAILGDEKISSKKAD